MAGVTALASGQVGWREDNAVVSGRLVLAITGIDRKALVSTGVDPLCNLPVTAPAIAIGDCQAKNFIGLSR
jgi:hypothetical protein